MKFGLFYKILLNNTPLFYEMASLCYQHYKRMICRARFEYKKKGYVIKYVGRKTTMKHLLELKKYMCHPKQNMSFINENQPNEDFKILLYGTIFIHKKKTVVGEDNYGCRITMPYADRKMTVVLSLFDCTTTYGLARRFIITTGIYGGYDVNVSIESRDVRPIMLAMKLLYLDYKIFKQGEPTVPL